MKKRIDYKSKKFVIAAILILIVSIFAVAGTVMFIKSNNNTEAITDEQIEKDKENSTVDNASESQNENADEDDFSLSTMTDRNNFSSLQTTIIEYQDVQRLTSKDKKYGWKPDTLDINIENSIGVNKTRIEISKEFTSYIDMSEEIEKDENVDEVVDMPRSVESTYGVEKEATANTKVDLHDVLTYTVTVKNTGNITVNNIEVVDTIVFGEDGNLETKVIESLEPNASESVTFEYTVTEEDVLNGEIVNSAIATIENKLPTELDEPVIVPTEDVNKDYTVVKELVDVNNSLEIPEKVKLNDVLTYEITVENIGNITLENVLVEDSLKGAVLVEGEVNPIEKLAPGETVSVLFRYVITEADVAEGVVTNSAVVSTGEDKKTPEDDVETPVNQDYKYTVKYLEKGTTTSLSDDKVVDSKYGTEITSINEKIEIDGYYFDSTNVEKLTVGVVESENIIEIYYVKRADLSYTVNYLEKETNEVIKPAKVVNNQVFMTEVISNSEVIDIEGYNFDSLDPEIITIVTDETNNVINLYYTKRADLSYTVNYLEKDTNAVLADAKVVNNQTYKAEVTENAIDIVGYNKVAPTTETITIDVAGNVINFYYTKRTDLSYTVNYLEQGTNAVLADAKVVNNQTYKAEVTEKAIDIVGYNKVTPTTQTITIDVTENVINFYYTKRTDLSYTVNYLEQGTNAVLSPAKVVSNQTFGAKVTEKAIDIVGYNKVTPTTETITIKVEGNVINFYYTKRTDLSYTVNYLEQGTNAVLADAKVVNNQTYKAEVTEKAIDIVGYNKVEPTTQTITIEVEGNVINFYYTKRTDLSYTVNYLEQKTNAVLAEAKVVNNQTYLDEVTENAIDIVGYNKVEPTSETITIDVNGNVINFYYTKRADLSYTVNYLEQGTDAVLADAKVVNNQVFGAEVTEIAIDIKGYNKVEPTTQTITIDVTENVINFYYTKRTDLSYTVNYLEKGTNAVLSPAKEVPNQIYLDEVTEIAIDIEGYNKVEPTTETITIDVEENVINFYYTKRTDLSYTVNYLEIKTEEKLAQSKVVNNQTFGDTVTEEAIDIAGYDKVDPTQKIITIEVDGNIINFYYMKRDDLTYVVNYLEEGTNAVLSPAKVVSDQVFGSKVTENAIDIEGYNKVAPTTETITIGVGDNVINFYYTKRTDLSYTVNYLEEGTNAVLSPAKVVNDQTYLDEVTETAIVITGYNAVEPTTEKITIDVGDNVINFYYTKRADLSYTVNYLEEGTNAVLSPAKVVNGQTYLDEVTETAIDIAGYDKVEPTSEKITIDVGDNVINFYYTKRTDLSYTVNYLEKDTNLPVAPAKNVSNQTFGESVTETAINVEGYNKVEPTTETITIKVDGNIINFYYTKRADLSYTVNYLEQGTNASLATSKVANNQVFGTSVTETAIDIEGYNKVEPTSETITIDVDENVINFYYTKRADLSYTVNYLEKGTNASLATSKVVNNQVFGSSVTETAISIDGYKAVDPTSETITIKVDGNVINFYYEKATYSYTVNYLEKDTNKTIAPSKVVNDVLVGTVITSSDEIKEINGYNYHSVNRNTLTITNVDANNVINIYYEVVNVTLTKVAVDANGSEVTPLHKYSEGETVRYKLTVKNNGTSTLKSYTVTDTLPSELSYSGTQPAGTTVNGKTLTWTITDLAGGASKSITIVTKINNDSWSSAPQDTYHSRDGVMLANGTEETIRKSEYRDQTTKNNYDTNIEYINASFHIYNSQRGEVPFEDGTTQYNGGYTTVGFGRVAGTAYNSNLTSIENLNSVIDTHNIIQDKIIYAPNYNPGQGKIVLWYVAKEMRYNGIDVSMDETFNGTTAYIKYHVDGIVVDLNNVYAVTNSINGGDGKTSADMVLVVDDSSTSTGITSNDTVRPSATSLRMVKSVRTTNIIEENIDDSLENTIPENTVPENTVPENTVPENTIPENTIPENTVPENTVPENTVPENTVPENTVPENTVPENTAPKNTVPENTVPENTIPENTIPENTVPENTVPENVVIENNVTEIIAEVESQVLENPIIEEVVIPNTELKELEESAAI